MLCKRLTAFFIWQSQIQRFHRVHLCNWQKQCRFLQFQYFYVVELADNDPVLVTHTYPCVNMNRGDHFWVSWVLRRRRVCISPVSYNPTQWTGLQTQLSRQRSDAELASSRSLCLFLRLSLMQVGQKCGASGTLEDVLMRSSTHLLTARCISEQRGNEIS